MAAESKNVTLALVDGVVLDPNRGGRGPWRLDLERRYGVDANELDEAFFRARWDAVVVGDVAIEPELDAVITNLGWPMSCDELLACWFGADFHVIDEVTRVARELHADGVPVVLATAQEHRRAAFLRDRLAAHLPIDAILYSADLRSSKPDLAFFVAATSALAQLGLPTDVVLVDDRIDNVEAACAHGWRAVHYVGQPGWRDELELALGRG